MLRLGPERQRRFFKARAIKFNRKLSLLGEKVLEPDNFKPLMIEGNTLMVFMAMDSINRERW